MVVPASAGVLSVRLSPDADRTTASAACRSRTRCPRPPALDPWGPATRRAVSASSRCRACGEILQLVGDRLGASTDVSGLLVASHSMTSTAAVNVVPDRRAAPVDELGGLELLGDAAGAAPSSNTRPGSGSGSTVAKNQHVALHHVPDEVRRNDPMNRPQPIGRLLVKPRERGAPAHHTLPQHPDAPRIIASTSSSSRPRWSLPIRRRRRRSRRALPHSSASRLRAARRRARPRRRGRSRGRSRPLPLAPARSQLAPVRCSVARASPPPRAPCCRSSCRRALSSTETQREGEIFSSPSGR